VQWQRENNVQLKFKMSKYRKLAYGKNHTSHDSVSVVRTTFKVYGKKQTLTLSQPKTPEPIVTKFERRDYVETPTTSKNLGSIRPGVFAPYIGEIGLYIPPVRNLLHFFVVLPLA